MAEDADDKYNREWMQRNGAKTAATIAARAAETDDMAIRAALKDGLGRRLLLLVLDLTMVDQATYAPGGDEGRRAMEHNEGRRAVGIELRRRIEAAQFDGLLLLAHQRLDDTQTLLKEMKHGNG